MIKVVLVKEENMEVLWNINQKYLYEMTSFYPDDMDEQGNLQYGYFDAYFSDPERKAYFIYCDETMVGFAMVHPYSVIGHAPDYTMAEFTVFPSYRRKGYALEAAKLILSMHKGKWEIKYNEKNMAAKKLWSMVTLPYNPSIFHLNEEETVFEFHN